MSDLSSIIADIRNGIQRNAYRTETDVRTLIVLRILGAIGWDVFDPASIRNEYALKLRESTRRVDLALCVDDKPHCIIELKSTAIDLDRGGTTDADLQLFEYAFHAGAPIALLTNGRIWKFYSIFTSGSYDERLVGQWKIETEIDHLIWALERYMSYKNTVSGHAAEHARTDIKTKRLQLRAKNLIPKAWQQLIQDPNSEVVRILVAATNSLAGSYPTEASVRKYLIGLGRSETPTKPVDVRPSTQPPLDPPKPKRFPLPPTRPPTSEIHYSLLGERFAAKNAKDAYVQVFEQFGRRHADFFERATSRLAGRKRHPLARTVRDLGLAASSKKRFARLSSGWLLITHLSNARKEKYLRIACEVAGIPFNDPAGLKISLTTSTGSNLKEKVPYILLGKSYNVKSAVEAYVSIFDVLSRRDGTFLERIQPKMKGRKLSMVARNQADVGPSGRPRQLSSGWWLYTNLSNRNKLRYLRIACDVAGIPFGDPGGLKIDL